MLFSLGAPLTTIAALYLAMGIASGLVVGTLAGLVSRFVELSPARLTGPLLLWFDAAVFLLRSETRGELVRFPSLLILVLIAGVVVLVLAWVWACRSRSQPDASLRAPAAATVCALLVAGGCALHAPLTQHSLPDRGSARSDAPNILFVLVDAMRADRVSAMGYPRPTTPTVDRLAAEGVLSENAYAHGNRTIISMPSLFTSLYPALTGAVGFQEHVAPLPADRVTIAEICRDAGYSTVGMMSNIYLKRAFGLTQGFDRVEEFNPGRFNLSVYRVLLAMGLVTRPHYVTGTSASATEVTDAAIKWLARAPSRSPVFCYVHYMDVHHPYLPPVEFEQMFRSRDSLAAIDPAALFAKSVEMVKENRRNALDDDELTRLSDLYDGCIRYVDTQLGRLLAAMNRVPNGRPTVVIFTGDHGDEFQEHGCLYHNNVVIQELIRVPLVMWRSDHGYGTRVTSLVRHVDVLPTIAEWAGAPVPDLAMGHSLTRVMENPSDSTEVQSIAEGDYCSALMVPGWKVMRVDTSGVDTLFDLSADPWGATDVSARYPDDLTRMRDALESYLRAVETQRVEGAATTNAETLRQLRALGYLN